MFTDLVRVETRLYNALDARLHADHGVTFGQVQFLRIVQDTPNCRVFDIVREVGITVGAVSKAVDRLEAAGLVRRSANPDDRRSSLLALTTAGARKLADAAPTVEQEIATWFDGVVTGRQTDQLAAALGALRQRLESGQTSSRVTSPPAGSAPATRVQGAR